MMIYSAASAFRWRARLWHLTYKGHIPAEQLLAQLMAVSGSRRVLGSSIVHETSDAEAPFDHTHFAWMWEQDPNLCGAHLMDMEHEGQSVHPHAVHKKSIKWMETVFTRYHHGHKADACGKLTFVRPAAGPWQQLPQEFEWNEVLLTEVSNAPDLVEGAQIAGIGVRSMHDVQLLQNAKRSLPFEHNFDRSSFKQLELPIAFMSRTVGTLHIYGEINLGKTEWACAQFENPLYVTERNQLLDFRAGWHDGIVIDKLLPRNAFTLDECEALTDFTQPAAIKCLFRVARVPKRTPKIFVTNAEAAWPQDPMGRIVGRRVAQLCIMCKTYV